LRVRAVEDRDLAPRVAELDERGDLGRDESRFGVLVLDLEHADGLTVAELRPQVLLLALAVVGDDRIRRAEDRVRGAVVLLERNRPRLAEVALELEDVADVRSAEGIDRLIRVPDRAQVAVLRGEQLEQP